MGLGEAIDEIIESLKRGDYIEIAKEEAEEMTRRSIPLFVNAWTGEGIYWTGEKYLVVSKNRAFITN